MSVLVIGFFILSAFCIIAGLKNYILYKESTSWPSVEGKITMNEISRNHGKIDHKFQYEYVVNNISFTGKVLTLALINMENSSEQERILSTYKVGEPATVFHHPNRPKVSILEPSKNKLTLLSLAIGVVLFFTALAIHTQQTAS